METTLVKEAELFKSRPQELDIIDFYDQATEDYAFWSKDYNMHFGYWSLFKNNIFKRDSMLNEMNNQVIKRLKLSNSTATITDLGCGMGGTIRYALKQNKKLSAFGVTLSKFQVEEGNKLLNGLNGVLLHQNFNHTSLASKSIDGAIAIESFCHAGHNKSSFQEAHRILKKGGRLVIADAFLKKQPNELGYGGKHSYKKLCNHWSLEKLGTVHEVKKQLEEIGFSNVKVENISFKVAPSVLHVPFAISGFILKKIFNRKPLKKESLHNLKGSFYALLSGLNLNSFGYYFITCIK